jgi:flagellar capping protein FliD
LFHVNLFIKFYKKEFKLKQKNIRSYVAVINTPTKYDLDDFAKHVNDNYKQYLDGLVYYSDLLETRYNKALDQAQKFKVRTDQNKDKFSEIHDDISKKFNRCVQEYELPIVHHPATNYYSQGLLPTIPPPSQAPQATEDNDQVIDGRFDAELDNEDFEVVTTPLKRKAAKHHIEEFNETFAIQDEIRALKKQKASLDEELNKAIEKLKAKFNDQSLKLDEELEKKTLIYTEQRNIAIDKLFPINI